MKPTMRTIVFAQALAAALAAAPAAAAPHAASAIEELKRASHDTARISLHRATGVARFARFAPGELALPGRTPAERAGEFFRRHGAAFGIADPESELLPPTVAVDRLGGAHLSYRQVMQGVPVFAGLLRVHFDAQGELTAVNGTFVPGLAHDPHPERTGVEAVRIALEAVASREARSLVPPLAAGPPQLVVFRAGLVRGIPGASHLVWEVEIGNGHDVRETLFVDAHTGKIVDRIPGIETALDREIHQGDLSTVIWSEGDPLPYTTGDSVNDGQVNGLIDVTEEVYALYSALSGGGYLSWDGADSTLHAVWKSTAVGCPNATWNGVSTNFCDGVASDDVVAHEWTHGYTEATHGLIYQWQPGALNESYSDIFGEIVDQTNGQGTDSPGGPRTSGDCSTFGGTPPPALTVLTPAVVAGDYFAAGASFNPAPPVSVTAAVQLANDGNGVTSDACEALLGFTAGRIALVDRGNCPFVQKVKVAQDAGASGVIVVNYEDSAFNMTGSDPSIVIPSVMVKSSDGQPLEAQAGAGLQASIELDLATAATVRWLNAEDSFAFGGAIRDLWNPTCFGDPGKVSDGQYQCTSGDGGGVHTNSGVSNHAFALLVDGGSYNGKVVTGLGLTKAAHIYWRSMSVYQVPDSDFKDHADALAASCADLIGVNLASLATGAPSGLVLSASDCAELDKVSEAVEFETEPPCNFAPLLAPDPPPVACGAVAFFDDFEQNPAGSWTLTNSGVFAEYDPRDWLWTSSVPEGGSGSAFFAIDSLVIGNCVPGDDDQSGVMFLDGPTIALGGSPLLTFDHWVATEPGYDGGRLEVQVNGGSFVPVSGSDFIFNPYNTTLVDAGSGNTNPLAGAAAWSGSDGGKVEGSWGQSQVNLAPYAGAGDTLRLRFAFGVDGCNGLRGWYVDNVRVCTSEAGAGRVPDEVPLAIARVGSSLALDWGASCNAGDTDYEVYEGTLGAFASHAPKLCSTAGLSSATITPGAGSRYYLVVPRNAEREGSYGTDSAGRERPASAAACLPQALACD